MKHAVHDTLTPPDAHAQQNSPIPVEQHTKTRVIIARHGNTFDHGDEVRRVGRHTDLPLSSSGQEQAQQLGLHLLTLTDETHTSAQCVSPLVAVYTSSLQRTQETARIALTTAGIEIPPTPSTDFDEIDYGPDENQPETVVEKRLGKATLAAWESDSTPPPGWKVNPEGLKQTWRDFFQKVVLDYTGKTVLVVTSNGIARFAPHCLATFPIWRQHHRPKLATGAIAIFEHDGTSWDCTQWDIKPNCKPAA